jgi:hypothetical protein
MKSILYHQDGSFTAYDERTLDSAKAERIEFLREAVTQHINQTCSASTQQNAALGIYPPERCEAIKSYISSCRNEYLRCKALIQTAQTNDEADAVQFLAPPVPEGM